MVPVSGATIQMYAVGTTGDGSPATALLAQSITSDSSGDFTLTGQYTCPSSSTLVYVTATGGNPGLASGTNNTASVLIGALGACGSLPSSFIMNEVTTVAAIWPLATFMSSPRAIGSSTSDASALSAAFTLASEFANINTGLAPGTNIPTGTTISTATVDEINTLADILSACVDSTGTSSSTTPCGQLFALTTPTSGTAPKTIAAAALFIAQNPTENVEPLFALLPSSTPFTPKLSGAPVDWSIHPSVAAMLTATPTSISFPSTTIGSAATAKIVTLNNTGTTAITLSSISITGTNVGDFTQSHTCGSSIAAGGSCTITVGFTPTVSGTRSAVLQIGSNASNAPTLLALTGTGHAQPIAISPAALTFPLTSTGTSSTPLSLTISAPGGDAVTASITPASSPFTLSPAFCSKTPCQIAATFTPTVTGTASASITITDKTSGESSTVAVTGTGGQPSLSLSSTSLSFPATNVGSSASTQSVTLTNSGTEPLAISSITLAGTNPGDFALSNACGSSVAAKGSCTLTIGFTPTAAGSRAASIQITSNAPGSPATILLAGTGVAVATEGPVTLSPASLTFTEFGIPQSVTVQNNGTAAVTISSIAVSNGSSSYAQTDYAQTNNCGTSLAAQSVCTVSVSALVIDSSAALNGTLSVTASDSVTPHTASLTTQQSTVTIDGSPIDFGAWAIGTTSTQKNLLVLTYPNGGGISDSITGPDASDFILVSNGDGAGCIIQCTVVMAFMPSALGTRNATLVTSYGNVPLSGIGNPAGPSFVVTDTSNPYTATINEAGSPLPVTVLNNGSASLNLTETISGPNASEFTLTNPCTNGLAPAATCTFDITFSPLQVGTRSAVLTVTDSTSGVQQTVALTGSGQFPPPSASPSSVNFGNIQLGSTSSAPITLSAPANHPLKIVLWSGGSPGFSVSASSCATTPCQINATFSPTSTGSASTFVQFTDTVSSEQSSVELSGIGGIPVISLSPSSIAFPSRNIGTTSVAQTVTLTNTGNAYLNTPTITLLGTNSTDFTETNTCTSTLAPNASCAISVSFAPQEAGSLSASVQITSNASNSPVTLPLTGTAN